MCFLYDKAHCINNYHRSESHLHVKVDHWSVGDAAPEISRQNPRRTRFVIQEASLGSLGLRIGMFHRNNKTAWCQAVSVRIYEQISKNISLNSTHESRALPLPTNAKSENLLKGESFESVKGNSGIDHGCWLELRWAKAFLSIFSLNP